MLSKTKQSVGSITSACIVFLICVIPIPAQTAIPRPLTAEQIQNVEDTFTNGLIYTDQDCGFTSDTREQTEIDLATLPVDVCAHRSRELVYLLSKKALVACVANQTHFAMKVVIGSRGIGKTKEGNRMSPFGTYWIGLPRHSNQFGIFIPIAYPNAQEIAKGYTGHSIGIHGPMRPLTCHPKITLAKNWTAGCIAAGRDSQIIELSQWILAHWPVRISLTKN